MRLTRRDALAALAAAGATGAVATAGSMAGRGPPVDGAGAGLPVGTLSAAAEVLYPSAVEGHREFVETYVAGRVADRPDYRAGMAAVTRELDDVAREWHGAAYADLPAETREATLDELGADTAEGDPDGTLAERLRYYVVEDLLYALYTTPTGGRLVGTENPVGFPGGTRSYRRAGPPDGVETDGEARTDAADADRGSEDG